MATGVTHGPHSLVGVSSGMIGIRMGAVVAPALFIAGYSVCVRALTAADRR